MDFQVKGLLQQDIGIEQFVHRDGMGNRIYSEPIVVKGYISGETKMIRDMDGNEVLSDNTIFLDGTDYVRCKEQGLFIKDLSSQDKINLYDGRRADILSVKKFWDENNRISIVEVNV